MSAKIRYEYQARGLLKHTGLSDYGEVTQEVIDAFRHGDHGLSPVTVEAYIVGFELLTGRKFDGDKLKAPMKRPQIIPLDDLSRVYQAAKDRKNSWFMRLLRFGYITGLRHHDLTRLTRDQIQDDVIEVYAGKTKKLHIIPRHHILRRRLPNAEMPLYRSDNTIYKWLHRFTEAAGVPYFTLQMLRRTAITQYELAHPGAGMILHGEGLRTITMRHYIDQYQILKAAQDRLAIPESMLPKGEKWRRQSQDKELLSAFHRLPDEERRTILKLVSRAG